MRLAVVIVFSRSLVLSVVSSNFGVSVGSPLLLQDQAATCCLLSCGCDWAACAVVPGCDP